MSYVTLFFNFLWQTTEEARLWQQLSCYPAIFH